MSPSTAIHGSMNLASGFTARIKIYFGGGCFAPQKVGTHNCASLNGHRSINHQCSEFPEMGREVSAMFFQPLNFSWCFLSPDIDDFIVDDDGQPLKKPKWRKKLPGCTDA